MRFPLSVYQWWGIDDNPPPAPDCLVIPSYALKDRATPTRPTRAAIELAVAWWQRFPQATLIMSTGDNQRLGISNAAVMAAYAAELGVPHEQIIEESRSRNTYENLLYSGQIIAEQGFRQPTLVTLDLYTRRAVATARKLGWPALYWVSVVSGGEPGAGHKWLQTASRLTILCYELCAMAYSRAVGWA